MKKTFDFLLREFFGAILLRMDALEAQGMVTMATVQELQDKADLIIAKIAEERADNQARYTDLREQIRVLQETGTPNLDAVAATLDAALLAIPDISEPIV